MIGEETGAARVLIYGHSAGGLIVSLWLDRMRQRGATRKRCSGLGAQQPVSGPARPDAASLATDGGALIAAIARVGDKRVARAPSETGGGYGASLHRDYHGEFDYNLQWKPLGGFPITFGWLSAVRRGQTKLHRGLDVGVPNLILRSDRSVIEVLGCDCPACGDAVLDVKHIARGPDASATRARSCRWSTPNMSVPVVPSHGGCLPAARHLARRLPGCAAGVASQNG